jgi:hypothetical protein
MRCGLCNLPIRPDEPTAVYGADFIPATLHASCCAALDGRVAEVHAGRARDVRAHA